MIKLKREAFIWRRKSFSSERPHSISGKAICVDMGRPRGNRYVEYLGMHDTVGAANIFDENAVRTLEPKEREALRNEHWFRFQQYHCLMT